MPLTAQHTAFQAKINQYARRLRAALLVRDNVREDAEKIYAQHLSTEIVRGFIRLKACS